MAKKLNPKSEFLISKQILNPKAKMQNGNAKFKIIKNYYLYRP
jgi:hypothetical protein